MVYNELDESLRMLEDVIKIALRSLKSARTLMAKIADKCRQPDCGDHIAETMAAIEAQAKLNDPISLEELTDVADSETDHPNTDT